METTKMFSISDLVLDDNYEVQQILGEGTFGKTLKAFDRKNKKVVAIKCIKDLNNSSHDDILHEIDIIGTLNQSKSEDKKFIVSIHDSFIYEGLPHLVFEYLPKTLDQLLKQRKLNNKEVTSISFALLKALSFLATAVPGPRIVHGDLKPENIMFDSWGRPKLIDFGLSFYEGHQVHNFTQSQYYRAPEVYLYPMFGAEIDIWSVACIIFECYTGKRLFQGKDDVHQLMKISEILGMLPYHYVAMSPRQSCYFQQLNNGIYAFHYTEGEWTGPASKSLYQMLGHELIDTFDCEVVNLLYEMLRYDPLARITPFRAICKPLFCYNHLTEPWVKVW